MSEYGRRIGRYVLFVTVAGAMLFQANACGLISAFLPGGGPG